MYNFNYYTPTKVVFGKNTEDKCGELVKEQGCKKVMIHYGSGSVKRTGLLDKVKASLDEAKIDYIELGGAVPNPRLSLVYEGIELAFFASSIPSYTSESLGFGTAPPSSI